MKIVILFITLVLLLFSNISSKDFSILGIQGIDTNIQKNDKITKLNNVEIKNKENSKQQRITMTDEEKNNIKKSIKESVQTHQATIHEASHDIGSGSWDDGYFFEGGLFINDNLEAQGTFYPKLLTDPTSSEEKAGLIFYLPKGPGDALAKFMFNISDKTNKYYIPLRFFSEVSSKIYSSGVRAIIGTLSNDKNERKTFILNLPWKLEGSFINDVEVERLCALINTKSSEIRQNLAKYIDRIKDVAVDYFSKYPIYEQAKKENDNIINELNIRKDELASVNKRFNKAKSEYDSYQDEGEMLNKELNEYNNSENKLQNQINGLLSLVKSLQKTQTYFENNTSTEEDKIKSELEASWKRVDTLLEQLINAAPQRFSLINTIREQLHSLKTEDYTTNIGQIVP